MPRTSPLRIFAITSILIVIAAIAVNANWGRSFGLSLFAAKDAENVSVMPVEEAALVKPVSEPAAMTIPLNAVTSFDAGMVARHVSGNAQFTSNEQKVAADASGNCAVSSIDAASIIQYVLGVGAGGTIGTLLPTPGPCATPPPGPNWPISVPVVRGDVSTAPPATVSGSGSATVSLPNITAAPGTIVVPITVSDLTGLGVLSYDIQVSFDSAIFTPAGSGVSTAGTLSGPMSVATNTANTGHLIISGYTPTLTPLIGSGVLLNLQFNVVDTGGLCSPLTFADWTDIIPRAHQGFLFNEGLPDVMTTNGCVTSGLPTDTATNTPTNTATPTNTPTATPTPPALSTYPDTSVPLSSNTTITPNAAPVNTTRINVSTLTGFVGELTADPLTGVVRVTNAHHANIIPGTYPVTVRAFGPGGTASTTFTLTVTDGTICNLVPGFTSMPNVLVGNFPQSVAIGDFNKDGNQDFATANADSDTVSIRIGDGLGGFSGTTEVPMGAVPYSVALGDFNNDGNDDITSANYLTNNVSIRLGDGLGGFSGTTSVAVGNTPYSVAVGDFDNDGKQDFASANIGSDTVSIRLGDGLGGFSGTTEIAVGLDPVSVAVGDFNNNGDQDIAVANFPAGTVSIRLGDGLGGFTSPPTPEVGVGIQAYSVAVGDFDNDGDQDIAIANSSSTISVRMGDGLGGFSGSTTVPVGNRSTAVAVGDFDNDGNQDIAATNINPNGDGTVAIRHGDGLGGFSGTTDLALGTLTSPYALAVGDFNNDGRQDIVAALFSKRVAIRLGSCLAPTPTDTPTGTPTETGTPTATATGTPPPPPCEPFIENFDQAVPPSYAVAYTGALLYTLSGGSSGGDVNGNSHQNAFIVSNFDAILQDQSGTGRFLYHQTVAVASPTPTPNYAGKIWGTVTAVPVSPNTNYVFSFYLTNRNAISVAQIEPRINGVAVGAAVSAIGSYDPNPANQWQKFSFPWPSGASTTAELSLWNLRSTGSGNDFGIDTIALELQVACTPTATPTPTATDTPTPTDTPTDTPTNTATPTATPSCEAYIEDFDEALPPSYAVPYSGDPLYTKTLSGSAIGGDINGNVHENAFILSNFDVILHDQSGTGRFLYHQTVVDGTPSYAGKVWGTVTAVPVSPNTNYVFSFYLTNRNGISVAQIEPHIDGDVSSTVAPVVSASGSDGVWQQFSFVWNSGSNTAAALSLWNLQETGFGNDFGIDTIALELVCTPTPTPTPTPIGIYGTITYGNAIGNPAPPRFVKNVTVASILGSPTPPPVITGTPGTYTLTGFGAGSYTIKPTKPGSSNTSISSNDAARVAQGVSSLVPWVTLNQKFSADASGNGTVSSNDAALIARFTAGLTGTGNVGQWKFFTANLPGLPTAPLPTPPYNDSRTYPSVTGVLTGEDYIGLLVGEVSGNWNPATHPRPVGSGPLAVGGEDGEFAEKPITVTVQPVVGAVSKEIIVPVSVDSAAGRDIISYEFDLRYDPAVIQPLENPVDVAGTVSRGLFVVTNPNELGLLRVVVYGPIPIDENGVLLNLRFTAVGKSGSVSPLSWERFVFNEGLPITTTDGQVALF